MAYTTWKGASLSRYLGRGISVRHVRHPIPLTLLCAIELYSHRKAMTMDYLKKIVHDIRERQANADSRQLPTPSCVREKSSTERNAEWHPPQWGILFCTHNKSYFEPCSACRRDKKRAKAEYEAFLKRHGVK
jgi:hypothetical protein